MTQRIDLGDILRDANRGVDRFLSHSVLSNFARSNHSQVPTNTGSLAGRLLLAYIRGILKNMNQKLTTGQKIDVLLEKVIVLDDKVTRIDKNVNDLIKTVGEIALLAGKTADRLEDHIKQTNHESKSGSFTPFTSGAFVA